MANELLSVPVAAGTIGLAAAGIGLICQRAKKIVTSDKIAMMGIMGAFIFAAQMVNFQLPFMPGTSGHMVGAVLLAIILGPCAGAIVISSVVIVQCLIFQDGGLLAIGCNLINMAIVPSFIGYYIYRFITAGKESRPRLYTASIIASIAALVVSAGLVPVQTALSGVLKVPFTTFLFTMLGVHLIIGIIEGLITAAVVIYLRQMRPEVLADCSPAQNRLSRKALLTSIAIATIVIAAGVSLFASGYPDGLEWSYAERPDQPAFESIVANESKAIATADNFQSRYSLMPDYAKRSVSFGKVPAKEHQAAIGWTSLAGVTGSIAVMMAIYVAGTIIRKRNGCKNAPCTN